MSDQADQCPADSGRETGLGREWEQVCKIPGGLGFKELNPQPRVCLLWVPPPWGTGFVHVYGLSSVSVCQRTWKNIQVFLLNDIYLSLKWVHVYFLKLRQSREILKYQSQLILIIVYILLYFLPTFPSKAFIKMKLCLYCMYSFVSCFPKCNVYYRFCIFLFKMYLQSH